MLAQFWGSKPSMSVSSLVRVAFLLWGVVDASTTTTTAHFRPPLRNDDHDDTRHTHAQRRDLIHGGSEAEPQEFPFFASMVWNGYMEGCGGSLIASKFVLTSAHCIETDLRNSLSEAERNRFPEWHVGRYCLEPDNCGGITPLVSASRRVWIHPLFDNVVFTYDFALAELEEEIPYTHTWPTLDDGTYSNGLQPGDSLRTIGFGQTSNDPNSASNTLKKVDNLFLPLDQCRSVFQNGAQFDDSLFCTNGADRGPCAGDSGSPVLLLTRPEPIQVGVTAVGVPQCTGHDHPDLVARVSSVHPWIVDHVCPAYNNHNAFHRPPYCPQPPLPFPTMAPSSHPSVRPSPKPSAIPTTAESASSSEPTATPTTKEVELVTMVTPPPPPPTSVPTSNPTLPPTPTPPLEQQQPPLDCQRLETDFFDKGKGKTRSCSKIKNQKKRKKFCKNQKSDALQTCPVACRVCPK